MQAKRQAFLFNISIIWILIISLFTWLPLVRIIGRPDEYYWGVFGMSGEGANGPYWIFIIGIILVLSLFVSVFRLKQRFFAYLFVLLWNLVVLYLTFYSVYLSDGTSIQGQGLHWEFTLWILSIPALLFTITSIIWIIMERKNGIHFKIIPWNKKNSIYLIISLVLLVIAIILFNTGDNYNWITSVAIITTIIHWIILIEAVKPVNISRN